MTLHATDFQWYPWNLNLMWKIPSFLWLEKSLFLWASPLLLNLITRKPFTSFTEKLQMKKKNILKQQHFWYFINRFYIRESFQGYHCKSGIAIFASLVPWKYAYSPFNSTPFIFRIPLKNSSSVKKMIWKDISLIYPRLFLTNPPPW